MQPRLLPELVFSAAERNGQALALTIGRQSLTYSDLLTATLRTTRGLLALGLRRYDRLAIYLPKSIENVVTLLATSAAGGSIRTDQPGS